MFTDGVTVRIDETTSYGPDAVVQCGATADLDAVTVEAPTVIVEVSLPSSVKFDVSGKLPDYFSLPSVVHVLIVDPRRKRIVKHSRSEGTMLLTQFFSAGDMLTLDPPGFSIAVADCFIDT